jgi:adenylosuccinate synthase
LNFLDYICAEDRKARDIADLSDRAFSTIAAAEEKLGVPVRYAGVGPSLEETLEVPLLASTTNIAVMRHG